MKSGFEAKIELLSPEPSDDSYENLKSSDKIVFGYNGKYIFMNLHIH